MPYIKEIAITGKVKEVCKKYSARYGRKDIARSQNVNITPEDVKKVNQRNAETKLRRLINTNFGYNDIHLVLTYRKGERPTPQESKKYLEKFLRDLRKLYRQYGIELKYISVTEYKNKAIHHHLVINSFDMREITPLWPYGRARPTFLDDTGQYGQLASYLIKETSKTFELEDAPYGKRWNQSRNLKKPDIKTTVINRNSWRKEPKPDKGYYLEKDKTFSGVSEITGYKYQFYSMVLLATRAARKRE